MRPRRGVPAAPAAGRSPPSITLPASSSCPRSARSWKSSRSAGRGPGRLWKPGPPAEQIPAAPAAKSIRIGYARCSTALQELQSQLDALARADCKRVFSEKISTRIKTRPELEKAKGLNALLGIVSTPLAAPVIAATRPRKGPTNSGRGAASFAAEAIHTAKECGASGLIVLRADSAFYAAEIIAACRAAPASPSRPGRTPR
ncbi:recombinase family protein [Streptomyces sp. A5-4]|uniref:recombinase family protein n=1 Tax=Streptomyces sp. A5-4 TaxID=3384771 RepID=UPI003DA8EDC7